MTRSKRPLSPYRRRLLHSVGALAMSPLLPVPAAADVPVIPALAEFLNGRTPAWRRLHLDLPRLADNGLSVSMKVAVDGPFSPGPHVRSIHVFSEKNPVPQIAVLEFPVPSERVEIESRIRLAGSQRVVAVATMSDGALFAASADVHVTLAACLDES
jgi:sulfur-oxidizing protein SoxY